jgi:hypothetical protein
VVIGEEGAERLAQAAEQNPPAEHCGGSRVREPWLDLDVTPSNRCLQQEGRHSPMKVWAWFTESREPGPMVLGTFQ